MSELTERRRSRRLDLTIAAVLVGAFVLTWGGISVVSAAGKADPSEYIAALGSAQTAADQLPAGFPASEYGHNGISLETAHFIGAFGSVKFWTAEEVGTGDLCLISIDAGTGMGAGSCAPPSVLQSSPMSLSTRYYGKTVFEAFLVGDAFSDAQVPSPWVKAGHNLVVIDGETTTGKEITLTSKSDSQSLTIRRFPVVPEGDVKP